MIGLFKTFGSKFWVLLKSRFSLIHKTKSRVGQIISDEFSITTWATAYVWLCKDSGSSLGSTQCLAGRNTLVPSSVYLQVDCSCCRDSVLCWFRKKENFRPISPAHQLLQLPNKVTKKISHFNTMKKGKNATFFIRFFWILCKLSELILKTYCC